MSKEKYQNATMMSSDSLWPILLKKSGLGPMAKSTRLRLESLTSAEASELGFHVATCKEGVFPHQDPSSLGKPTFSTQSAEIGH
jgi:hypothetical protein